jgi:NAD(P)-dependent dehydrogenase (short-subunit alcohol dehydrogenase family)
MDLKLAGKRALVTGASKGIGQATAEVLAREGCDLVLVARSQGLLDEVRAGIAKLANVRVDLAAADLSESRNIERLARDFAAIDILVNNAGAIPGGTLQAVDEATWRRAWDLKVFGYVNMCRAFYPLIKARGGGAIVNVVGNAAQTHDPEYICGVAGNAALTAFSQSLGSVSWRDNIRVVAVNPGPVETERLVTLMRRKAKDRTGDEANWRDLFKPLPFGRASSAEEIGSMVAFLASERSGYTSGSYHVIDGGLAAKAGTF